MDPSPANESVTQLLYFSRHNPDLPFNIEQLLDSSRKNNAQKGVTGGLLFTGAQFIQFLEGPSAAVNDVFCGRICGDRRHTDVHLLHYAPAMARLYSGWDMKFLGTSDAITDPLFSHIRLNGQEFTASCFGELVSSLKREKT